MTVGTNALLAGHGARTALIATAGFSDLLEIGRQNRPSLYHLCAPKPEPLVEDGLKLEAAERIGPDGVIEPLADSEIERLVAAVRDSGAEAVAICLLFAYRDPAHERAIAAALRAALPDVHVSASHEVLAQFREYERCSTTVIDAYLSPLLGRYLGRLGEVSEERGLPAPDVMLSSGGPRPDRRGVARRRLERALGARRGRRRRRPRGAGSAGGDALGLDMGGTSCDVCVVEDGAVRRTDSRTIDGRVIQLPMVDIHTVGAGGGSVGWRDSGGALRVGPRSAGADPGPACYGRGGEEPTVTDANLVLGYLDESSELAGGVALDRAAADRALERLAGELGLEPLETAEGIVRVANQEMVRALRVVTVERGIDPRRFALMPFGGAGPMHAAAIADELGIDAIVCPRAGGVLSALGMIASERRRDGARTVLLRGDELTARADRLRGRRAPRGARRGARGRLGGGGLRAPLPRARRSSCRSPRPADAEPADLAERFAAAHEERYGYRDPDGEIELVTIRLALTVAATDPALESRRAAEPPERSRRRARFAGEWVEADVLRGEPASGTTASGPCVWELPETTLVLPGGWTAEVDDAGHGPRRARRG